MAMQLRLEFQRNPVADPVSALIAVVRPILEGVLYSLKRRMVVEAGGYERVSLEMLARLYVQGDGDCGLCFEYAIHDAVRRGEPWVVDRVIDAMSRHCRIPGRNHASILFGAEKTGALRLLDTAKEILTEESVLMYGYAGRPAKLRRHIDSIAAAFRKREAREALPWSISGLWKADLFLGYTDTDKWVGTTVKTDPNALEPARGLRIGIVPGRQGRSDAIKRDERRNLVVCPIPYDGAFVEVFRAGWRIVQQVIAAHGEMPSEVALPLVDEREVAKALTMRRRFPVLEVVQALRAEAQPELLDPESRAISTVDRRVGEDTTGTLEAPVARRVE